MRFDMKAMAITVAFIWGGAVLIVGLANLIWPGYGQDFLHVVASIYPGYGGGSNIGQVIIGTLYGIVDGAVGGALFAWVYNVVAGR